MMLARHHMMKENTEDNVSVLKKYMHAPCVSVKPEVWPM